MNANFAWTCVVFWKNLHKWNFFTRPPVVTNFKSVDKETDKEGEEVFFKEVDKETDKVLEKEVV